MDRCFRHRTADVHNRRLKGWRGQPNVRIVRKTEALLRYPDQVAIELRIAILIVNRGHSVISWPEMVPYHGGLAITGQDRSGPAAKCLLGVLRPSIRGREYHRADHAD